MARGDDAVRIVDDWVVQKHGHVILCGEERGYVAVKDEVRLDRSLDRLVDPGIGLVQQIADLQEDVTLPGR